MEKLFLVGTVTPHQAGFGQWEVKQYGDVEYDLFNLVEVLADGKNKVYEIGKDELPKEIENIENHIVSPYTKLFAVQNVLDDEVSYIAALELE